MSFKRWVKAVGRPARLAHDYRQAITLDAFHIELTCFTNNEASRTRLGQQWLALQQHAEPSIFLSWAWLHTWLEVIVEPDLTLLQLMVRQQDDTVGLALVPICQRGAGPLRSRTAFLNELPLPGRDLTMEKNGVLAHAGMESMVFSAAIGALARCALDIDEIRANGVDQRYLGEEQGVAAERDPALALTSIDESRRCWLLGKSASSDSRQFGDLLNQLSKSRRWQISRFQRLAEEEGGAIVFECATTVAEAERWFDRLAELHTAYWQQQGKPGVFRNARWRAFHWQLIERLLPSGRVQLARVRAGEIELGYLYNLQQGAEMVNIQSGFAYREDNRWRPGYLSHLLAAAAAAEQGCSRYDLLMGDDSYKSSIARPGAQLCWLQIFPHRLLNQRLLMWRALALYRRLRTSSRPNAQGELRS